MLAAVVRRAIGADVSVDASKHDSREDSQASLSGFGRAPVDNLLLALAAAMGGLESLSSIETTDSQPEAELSS